MTTLAALLVPMRPPGSAVAAGLPIGNAVVKIYFTQQREDYSLPWQAGPTFGGTGSGFVIRGRRILTNAHIVSDARFIQVRKLNDSAQYSARVEFIGHDCDLAVLTVADRNFFSGLEPVDFAQELPNLNDEVLVLGYPLGGTRLSVTRGVVSRIDYSVYSHSGVDQHLVLQVDAAINPGNSGGPVVFKGKVVGLAFQGLAWAENIGYAIPFPVIQHFLDDIADSVYHGYPEIGLEFIAGRNPALRRAFQLPEGTTGIVISYIDPFGSAAGKLAVGDALLSIDGLPIAQDGTVSLGGHNVHFAELLERKQWGASVKFEIRRGGADRKVLVPLTNPRDPFVYRNLYDERPRYFVLGGLVFSQLTREYLRTVERLRSDERVQQLFYYSEYAKQDDLYKGRDEFVVLIRRLPHPVNTYADEFVNGIVESVNGIPIRNLSDVKTAAAKPVGNYHVIRFAGLSQELVLDAEASARSGPEILAEYGVPAEFYLGEAP